jgi:hypothetical protein
VRAVLAHDGEALACAACLAGNEHKIRMQPSCGAVSSEYVWSQFYPPVNSLASFCGDLMYEDSL